MPVAAAPRVVISGWYGVPNLGDELLLSVIGGWIRAAGGVPVVLSVHPALTMSSMGFEAVPYMDRDTIEAEMRKAALFVMGGGGLLQEYDVFAPGGLGAFPAGGSALYVQHFLLARAAGVPTVALAQGVGPLRSPLARMAARELFERADGVSVRDEASAALLREIGVQRSLPVAPDPGWSHRPLAQLAGDLERRWRQLAGRKRLAIILRSWPFTPGWEDAFIAGFGGRLPADWSAVWLDFSPPAGAGPGGEIAKRMVARLDGDEAQHVVWDGNDVEEASAVIASCDACLAMRLHGLLLGAAAGLPCVAVEYDDKVAALAQSIGLPAVQRVSMHDLAARLPAALGALVAGGARCEASLRERFAREALAHRDILATALARARADDSTLAA